MQKHGIQARGKRKFRVTTTDSKHNLPIAPNILDRNFTVAAPNQAWVGGDKTTLLLDIAAKFGDQAIYVAGIQRSISVTR
jgi:transposase InsO family protein